MKVKLTKLSNNVNALRTNEVIGKADNLPVIGESFVMTSKPLDPNAAIRLIRTSPVKYISGNMNPDHYIIHTENSTYLIEVLGEG